MSAPENDNPEIVNYKIPKIEIYHVTSEELTSIEEEWGQVGQDLTFTVGLFSSALTLVVTLLMGEFSIGKNVFLETIVVVFVLIGSYTGWRWLRVKGKASRVIANIRSRRPNPES